VIFIDLKPFPMNRRALAFCLFSLFGVLSLDAQIQPGRAIQISVQGVPNEEKNRIDAVYPVSESGNISMPFIGTVRAAGLLSEQLGSILQQRYKSAGIYTDPIFHVIDSDAKKIDQQVVYFGGDVRRTGPIPYNRNLTLYQALQAAGGQNEFGSIKRVAVFRNGKRTLYDLTNPQHMDVLLQPNDTIDVPRKNIIGQ
jgi:protein involved in polysaccharide export with SLBB domain